MNFCVTCATPLKNICRNCGSENPIRAHFCGGCAAPLAAESSSAGPHIPSEAERRQLTVMFCDLVGSTQLSQRLDPEELREVVKAYQETCAEVIRSLDGQIAQYLGDGLLVYFGYPQAHEDDPVRAVSAALGILHDLPRLNDRIGERLPALRKESIQVRIGIHTGPVVVGEMGGGERQERLALGDTLSIASRLQGVTEPGWVVISEATRNLIRGVFVLEDLGRKSLKGIAEAVPVYRVIHRSGVRSRLEITAATGLTPLVGREQEVAMILDRWEQVKEGHGQVLFLGGEAGMGKSRLVQVLRERLEEEPHTWLDVSCSAYRGNSAFHPVVELLEKGLIFGGDDSSEVRLAKLERALRPAGFPLHELIPLFAPLMSIPLPERYPPVAVSPEAQRRRTLESLMAWLFSVSEQQPMVLVVEDLHWIDPSTLELLGMLVEQAPTVPVLLLLTFRPDFELPWAGRSHLTHLTLNRLTRRQMNAMVDAILGGKALPDEVLAQVLAKTDGVPLFVEELTKMVLESGLLEETDDQYELIGPLPELAIPSTLQDSLMARLDRFGSVKEVAQFAAVLGRAFSHELIEAVSPVDAASLDQALARLVRAEILYQRGVPPRAAYIFKHALIQDTAYQSLLRKQRQQYHGRIARTLEQKFPEQVVSEPELVARHYEEGGFVSEAISHYGRAGEQATARSAHKEAIGHLTRGIALLRGLPESRERDERELMLQVALGAPLMAVEGYSNPEVERAYGRARELCREIGEGEPLMRALWGLGAFYQARGELGIAHELGKELLGLAERAGDTSLLLLAHLTVGATLYYQGDWSRSLEHLEQTTALYDPAEHRSLAFFYGQDPGVASRTLAAMVLWHLGCSDRARERSRQAIALGREGVNPFGLAFALGLGAGLQQMLREREKARELAEEAVSIGAERGFPVEQALGKVFHGWALADAPAGTAGLEKLQEGLARLAAIGTDVAVSYFLSVLAEAQQAVGREQEALGALEAGLAWSKGKGHHYWDAELYRMKGELLLRMPDRDGSEAESLFRRAIAISRDQMSKALELRAAMSLSRLLQGRGLGDEARALLDGVTGGFKEGFDTQDLRDAKALLEAMS
jgi:class 3 adenylate cyclase/predicted ATPase